MLKTNARKTRENVRRYIVENADDVRECAAYDGETLDTAEAVAAYVYGDFVRVKGHELKHRNIQEVFSEYASGLPFSMFDYYYNVEAVQVVGDMLEESDDERARFTEAQAEHLADYLIFRECAKAAGRW